MEEHPHGNVKKEAAYLL